MKKTVLYFSDVSLKDREIVYVEGAKLFGRDMKQIGFLTEGANPAKAPQPKSKRSRNC